VGLEVEAPVSADVVTGEEVDVSGSVEPDGATVSVLGQPARVVDGRFDVTVPLEPGANVIDVLASAGEREPAMQAVWVTRELPVPVPQLGGLEVGEAEEAVAQAGLELEVEERSGGLLDDLFGSEATVCEQVPGDGTLVRPGSTVRVVAAPGC